MTVKQKQCLLEYLGCYLPEKKGAASHIDGLWGPASEAATRVFQENYGLMVDGIFGPATEQKIREVVASGETGAVNWNAIRYFGRGEFMCNCGGKYCNGFPAEPNPVLVKAADRVRGHFGAVAYVSSGVRCVRHNANVGGVPNSRHLSGKAMDFCVSGKTAEEVLAFVQQQPEIAYSYAIDSYYVHMDVR